MKPDQKILLVHRHSLITRATHWLNAICLALLLLSGLQIFNAWPSLYWGQYGADGDHSFLSIGAEHSKGSRHGVLRLGDMSISTTGVLGVSNIGGETVERAFPEWLTLPSFQDLAEGRRWHFFFAWCFIVNGAVYLAHGLLSGHLRRDLMPTRRQLAPAHLWQEIVAHARLRFPKGEEARRYNVLQKLSYLGVAGVLLPLMVLTGATMSPGINAVAPFLPDLFGGRQSARAVHFITASFLVLFVLVHLFMVLLSGVWNNLRSMITGRYAIDESETHHD